MCKFTIVLLVGACVAAGQVRTAKAPTYKELQDELVSVKGELRRAHEKIATLEARIRELDPPPLDERIKQGIAEGKPVVGMTMVQCEQALRKAYSRHVVHESESRTQIQYYRSNGVVLTWTCNFNGGKLTSITNHDPGF